MAGNINVFSFFFPDFPEAIANSTLDDLPNSLYRFNYATDILPNDLQPATSGSCDQGQGHPDHFINHRRNHGTNPSLRYNCVELDTNMVASFDSTSSAPVLLGALPSWTTGSGVVSMDTMTSMQTVDNSVPYNLYDGSTIPPHSHSYASIAQRGPSQCQFNMVARQQGHSSVAMVTSDQKACDNSNRCDNTARKRVQKGGNKSRYGNVNINVVDLIEDLERADALSESRSGSSVKVTSAQSSSSTYQPTDSGETLKFSYSSVLQETIKSTGNSGSGGLVKSQISSTEKQGHTQSQGHQVVKGQSVQSGIAADLHELLVQSQNQVQGLSDNNTNEGEGKKKRRRRRRRKKKSGDGEAADNEDVHSGANEEITLHFEDEDEFPDLACVAGGNKSGSQGNTGSVSYSEILKNNVSKILLIRF